MKTISFILAPATKKELTNFQARNARSRSIPSASFRLQPHERTYILSSQEFQEQMNTISFILAPATGMKELTRYQTKNASSRSTLLASF
jgi:hypothetical protein